MKRLTHCLFLIVALIYSNTYLNAQSEKFSFIAELGYMKSQIDGDKLQGFHKGGYQVAIGSNYSFTESSKLLIKTSYNLQGSKRKDIFQDKLDDGIQLEVDLKTVAVEASYRFSPGKQSFYLGAGFVYHRILSLEYEIIDNVINGGERIINPDLLGNSFTNIKFYYGFPIAEKFGLTLYIENSLTDILKSDYFNIMRLEPYLIGANFTYELKASKKKKKRRRRRR